MRAAVRWQRERVSSYYNETKYFCYSKHEYKQDVEFVSRHFTVLYEELERLEAAQGFPARSHLQ